MDHFIGRPRELQRLKELTFFNRPCLVVIRGRRRIGKSRLVEEFAKGKKFLPFSGLPPEGNITAQDQRDTFARQLAENFSLSPFTFKDWSDAFSYLSNNLKDEPTVILFDEISWMGSKDRTFIAKLKTWWDLALQKHTNLTLIFCGSVSTWISKNIINSTAFFGRITLNIVLTDLSLPESYEFIQTMGYKGSFYDAFKILSITGGIPWYLEQVLYNQTVDENIKRLCFEKEGLLVTEFKKIFHDLFKRKNYPLYKKIINTLAEGMRDLETIRIQVGYAKSGSLSNHLKNLVISGFVTEHFFWSIKTGNIGKQKLYRLSDNYLRFYVKYIEPNLPKIENDAYQNLSLTQLPGWESMLGFQLESLLLKNRALLQKMLGINPSDIVADNPYLQHATERQKGCQIDYLIQTQTNNLFIFEFKFRKHTLDMSVVHDMQEKIQRLSVPRGFGICPVLVCFGDVADSIVEKNFFYRIIDIKDLIESRV